MTTACGKIGTSGRRKPQFSESRDIQSQTKHPVLCHCFYRDFGVNALSKLKEMRERTAACLPARWSPDRICMFHRWYLWLYVLGDTLAFQQFSMNNMIVRRNCIRSIFFHSSVFCLPQRCVSGQHDSGEGPSQLSMHKGVACLSQ